MANQDNAEPWDGGLTVCGAQSAEPIRIESADVLAALGWSREDRGQYSDAIGRVCSHREKESHRCRPKP